MAAPHHWRDLIDDLLFLGVRFDIDVASRHY